MKYLQPSIRPATSRPNYFPEFIWTGGPGLELVELNAWLSARTEPYWSQLIEYLTIGNEKTVYQ